MPGLVEALPDIEGYRATEEEIDSGLDWLDDCLMIYNDHKREIDSEMGAC